MKVLVFVVGFGECMCLLILYIFKLLLEVVGKLLIVWYLECLVVFGVCEVVVNIVWLVEQFLVILGDGSQWGLCLYFFYEGQILLEIGGGIFNVLLVLGDVLFLVVNGDIWIDFDFVILLCELQGQVYLVLVDNLVQYLNGDYWLDVQGLLYYDCVGLCLIYVGIGVYCFLIVVDWCVVIGDVLGSEWLLLRFLVVLLQKYFMVQGLMIGQYYCGCWIDVGIVDCLCVLDVELVVNG